MAVKPRKAVNPQSRLYDRIREILESARASVVRSVNTAQVVANWLIGREIVEEQQQGKERAGYGEALLADLAKHLTEQFGRGWSVRQLEYCRSFYLAYPALISVENWNAVRSNLIPPLDEIVNAVRSELPAPWQPGKLNPSLSWTHYRTLMRVNSDKNDAVVKYTLGDQLKRNIFTSRYQLYLPTEEELQQELCRELRQLSSQSQQSTKKRTRKT